MNEKIEITEKTSDESKISQISKEDASKMIVDHLQEKYNRSFVLKSSSVDMVLSNRVSCTVLMDGEESKKVNAYYYVEENKFSDNGFALMVENSLENKIGKEISSRVENFKLKVTLVNRIFDEEYCFEGDIEKILSSDVTVAMSICLVTDDESFIDNGLREVLKHMNITGTAFCYCLNDMNSNSVVNEDATTISKQISSGKLDGRLYKELKF